MFIKGVLHSSSEFRLSAARPIALQGLAAVALQWGAWGGGGMAAEAGQAARLARSGMGLLPPGSGLAALAGALRFRAGADPSSQPPARVHGV